MHPLAGSQESSVQASPSSQTIGVPEQVPAEQWSSPVQALASEQARSEERGEGNALAGSQASSVQASPSSQTVVVPEQVPDEQCAWLVQALASEQALASLGE